jgi:hypothetical protein
MSKSSFCYLCGKPIKFDYEYINERTGKKIPLDAETNEPHNCPVRRSQREQQQSQPPQLHTTTTTITAAGVPRKALSSM